MYCFSLPLPKGDIQRLKNPHITIIQSFVNRRMFLDHYEQSHMGGRRWEKTALYGRNSDGLQLEKSSEATQSNAHLVQDRAPSLQGRGFLDRMIISREIIFPLLRGSEWYKNCPYLELRSFMWCLRATQEDLYHSGEQSSHNFRTLASPLSFLYLPHSSFLSSGLK